MEPLPIEIIRDNHSLFFLWCGNDDDRDDFVYSNLEVYPAFRSVASLHQFASEIGYLLTCDVVINPINFDVVESCGTSNCASNARHLLSVWNILMDFNQLQSEAWIRFGRLSDQHREMHAELSTYVLSNQLSLPNHQTVDMLLKDEVKSTLLCGIEAFDESISVEGKGTGPV